MKYFPFFFDLAHKRVLIVGGGAVALSKAKLLLKTSAVLSVVSPRICDELKKIALLSKGEAAERIFREQDLDDSNFVVSATDLAGLNERISGLCKEKNIPVNVVDRKELCDFIFPSIVDRDPFVVALSTQGIAPVLGTFWRNKLERLIPKSTGKLLKTLESLRGLIKNDLGSIIERRRFYLRCFNRICPSGKNLNGESLKDSVLEMLNSHKENSAFAGQVYLVGAGPGDPELLTVKAAQLLSRADVVLYDRLVSPQILDYCRREAEFYAVGKSSGHHPVPQEEIHRMMLMNAKQNKTVIRLKGGDPMIYGRGGEEIEFLKKNGVRVETVPGVTAVLGAASVCDIPITRRGVSDSVSFHALYGRGQLKKLGGISADANQTLVFYMSGKNLIPICKLLTGKGFDSSTPFALVQNATLPNQSTYYATISNPEPVIFQIKNKIPSIIIVGRCVEFGVDFPFLKTVYSDIKIQEEQPIQRVSEE